MILTAQKLWADGYDLTGDLSGMALEMSAEMQDDTVFGDVSRSNVPGLIDFRHQHEGVWNAGAGEPDDVLQANFSLADVLASIAPVDGSVGSLVYFMLTTQGQYQFGGQVGDLNRFSVNLAASGGAKSVRGQIAENANLASTGDGTALNLGAVSASQKLYAGLHVLSAAGSSPTLDVIIESDSQSDFLGSPSTRITFAEASAIGSEWATPVAGAITDTWWRASWTIGGTSSPNFDAVVVIGIQ